MKQQLRLLIGGLACIALFARLLTGCSVTHTLTQDSGLIEDVGNGKYQQATEALRIAKEKGKFKEKDFVLYYLNQGMLHHYEGNYSRSNEYLTLAERKIEDLFTKSISRIGASFLLNDNVLDYSGEDYEDIYINVFKALNYIHLGKKDDAFVEINRTQNKLRQLTDKYVEYEKQIVASANAQRKGAPPEPEIVVSNFHNCVLARYLSMLLYLTEKEVDKADIDRRKIKEAWTTQPLIYSHEIPDFIDGADLAQTNLQIIAFTGLAPAKQKSTYYITTLRNALNVTSTAPEVYSATIPWLGMEPNYHFKLSMPYMALHNSHVHAARVIVDGESSYDLVLLESMENVALETFKIKAPLIYFKSLARTITKGISAAEAKKDIDEKAEQTGNSDYLGVLLAKAAIDVAMDLTESADLRTSMFFPAKAMVTSLALQPGLHDIRVEYLGINGRVLHSENYNQMLIQDNGMSFIETYYLK